MVAAPGIKPSGIASFPIALHLSWLTIGLSLYFGEISTPTNPSTTKTDPEQSGDVIVPANHQCYKTYRGSPGGPAMKLLTEYLEHALTFERLAAAELDPKLKAELEGQAKAYGR
jgi:hypothetical protein